MYNLQHLNMTTYSNTTDVSQCSGYGPGSWIRIRKFLGHQDPDPSTNNKTIMKNLVSNRWKKEQDTDPDQQSSVWI